jgi:FAD/FMN-containing dehydrogenase
VEEEFPAATLDLMRRVKQAFDPDNLFNPGKILRQ